MSAAPVPSSGTALLVVDVQQDFCPGGALAVPEGDVILPAIRRLMTHHEHVVLTQDWHPPDHISFASAHPRKRPLEVIDLAYGKQILWPDHCVRGTAGVAFHAGVDTNKAELILRKGFRREIDSYSAFFENDHRTSTGLAGYLRERGLGHLVLCGLALDFCVAWSAVDARKLGFEVEVVVDACRAIDTAGSLAQSLGDMASAGVLFR